MRVRSALASLALAASALVVTAPAAKAEDGLAYRDFVTFEQSVFDTVNDYWAGVFATHNLRYTPPRLLLTDAGRYRNSGCAGGVSADPADRSDASPAFYCPADRTIYLASGWMYRQPYQRHGDFAAAVVIAHEMAHHTQAITGTTHPSTKPHELQADCWAGTWGRHAARSGQLDSGDLQEGMNGVYAAGDYQYDSPDHHGTPKERYSWFRSGYQSGDPAQCNP